MSEEIRPGRYRHFKGKEYEVLYLARHSETEEEMVVYRAREAVSEIHIHRTSGRFVNRPYGFCFGALRS